MWSRICHLSPRLRNAASHSHVEAKHAAWMKDNGIAHATVVINKNSGVCAKKLNCENAVEAILPAGPRGGSEQLPSCSSELYYTRPHCY
ncbi:DddA-like double-stranded DNA deaminase toxin [Streptomyces sp. NPDC058001]|uniref:DddA-like double-stranded DNA deaminase toxin n=1 Tax=Streptomyces sp. NPDC058001 TaxID=3346300 RepID=UPI0036E1F9CA